MLRLFLLPIILIYIFLYYYDIYSDPNKIVISPIQFWKEKYEWYTKVEVEPQYKYDCIVEPNCDSNQLICYSNTKCNKIKQELTKL